MAPSLKSAQPFLSLSQLVNQSLLANRRNVAFLQLRLREENLQQTSLFRLHWDHCLNRWRRNRVGEVVQRFRLEVLFILLLFSTTCLVDDFQPF